MTRLMLVRTSTIPISSAVARSLPLMISVVTDSTSVILGRLLPHIGPAPDSGSRRSLVRSFYRMFPRPGQLPLVDFPVPATPTERGDEEPGRIARIDDHAVTPLEVEAGNAPPRQAAIGGPPGGGLEARSVEHTGVARVDRHVVHVLVLREDPAPCCAGIGREIDAAVLRALRSAPAPGGQVQTAGVLWVDGQAARTVDAPGQRYAGPVLCAVGRAVEGAVPGVCEAAVVAAASNNQVERALRITREAPGKRLRAFDAGVLESPALSPVGGLEHAPAEARDVQRAPGVAQDVGGGCLRHTGVLHAPGASAVVAAHDTTVVRLGRSTLPHLGPWQVVHAAHDCPHPAAHVRVEFHPVRGVDPRSRHAAAGRAVPAGPVVVAGNEPDIRVADEHVARVEGVEVHAIAGGDVEAVGRPAAIGRVSGVGRLPGRATVERTNSTPVVGGVHDVGRAWRDSESDGVAGPPGIEALGEPGIAN